MHFYSRLDIGLRQSGWHAPPADSGAAFRDTYDDDSAWAPDFAGLHSFAFFGCVLLLSALPLGLQSSALLAENCVVPYLVIFTLKAHVSNFTQVACL